MNYFPLKEIGSSLQNISEQPTVESQPVKKVEISKKTLILISIGFLSAVLSLGIPLGIVVQTNHYEAKFKKDLASYIQNLPDVHLQLSNSAILHNNPDILEFLLKNQPENEAIAKNLPDVHLELLESAILRNNPDVLEFILKNQPKNETIAKELVSEALFLAVELDNLGMAENLIKSGANVSTKNDLKETPIHLASSAKMIKLLIDHGSDPNDQDLNGGSALHKDKDVETTVELIENGANINTKNKRNVTTLMAFASFGKPEVVKVLIENGAKVNDVDYYLRTPLHYASKGKSDGKDRAYIAEILLQNQAKVDAIDKWPNDTSLHYACKNGDLEVVKVLLKHDANPNAENVIHQTPLIYLSQFSRKSDEKIRAQIAEVLLQHGANVNAVYNDNTTSLHFACRNEVLEVVKVLIKHGANPNAQRYDETPIFETKDPEIATFLLQHGASVDHQGEGHGDNTRLCVAARSEDIEMTKVLLNYGANPNITCHWNRTALQMATFAPAHYDWMKEVELRNKKIVENRTELIELLLKHGAKVDVTDWKMKTPLHYVAYEGNPSEAKLLIDYGANVHAKSTDGKTPLDVAFDKKNEDLINFLKQYQ